MRKKPTPPLAQQLAAGKAIVKLMAANECLQHEAGTMLGFTSKQSAHYVRVYKASIVTVQFVDRLTNALNYYRAGNSFDDSCAKFHVIPASLKQALRQQPKAATHFQHR